MNGVSTIHAGASLGLPAPWTDQTGTALRRPDGTSFTPASDSVDGDRYLKVFSKGARIFDWRTTLIHTLTSLATTEFCPDGSAAIAIPGDGMSGGANCTTSIAADISTVGVSTVGVWVRVPARSSSLKGYLGVPVKILLAPLAGFGTAFCTFTFMARADSRWHFYVFDVRKSSAVSGTWAWGTSGIGTIRARTSVDQGVYANPIKGTDPLQTGETAYMGGVWINPRTKAAAIVRFDDGMSNLTRVAQATLVAPYVGQSGVTVPTGSYTAKQLVDAFGLVANCFVLTRHIDTTADFATSAELLSLQADGWDICFQSHYNPRSSDYKGARLMGPAGFPWVASGSHSYVSGGTITFATPHTLDTGSVGQSNMIELTGTPPAPLTTGVQYWARNTGASTATLHTTEVDALAGTNPITFAGSSSATFAVNHWRATLDKSGELEDMTLGKAAMQAFGFRAWACWAPNQGAWSAALEEAFVSLGYRYLFPTNQFETHGFSSGGCSQIAAGNSVTGELYTTIPYRAITQSAYQTDAGGGSEAAARTYVQSLCATGGLGQNYHHGFTNANVLVLCAYLDELKLRQDRGELDVVTASRMADMVDAISY